MSDPIFAHLEVPGSIPWVDEFFGHPHEYWPLYLLIYGIITVLVVLFYRLGSMRIDVNYLMRREESMSKSIKDVFENALERNSLNLEIATRLVEIEKSINDDD